MKIESNHDEHLLFKDNYKKYTHIKSHLIYGNEPPYGYLISVFIPTYRRANTLKQAIDSAFAQTNTSPFFIVVVDNDSDTDLATDMLMQKYCSKFNNITYYRNEQNIGMFGNWNRCIELCPSKWICILHDDDMLMPDYLLKIVPILERENCDVLTSFSKLMQQHGNTYIETHKMKILNFLKYIIAFLSFNRIFHIRITDVCNGIGNNSTGCVYKTSSLKLYGGFDDEYFPSSDFLMYGILCALGTVVLLPKLMSIRGVGQNEMLKPECIFSLIVEDNRIFKIFNKLTANNLDKFRKLYIVTLLRSYRNKYNRSELIPISEEFDLLPYSSYPNLFFSYSQFHSWLRIILGFHSIKH